MKKKTDTPRGVLHTGPAPGMVEHDRYHPSPDLAFFVEHFWTVRWNFEGLPPLEVGTIPYPSVHLVFEKDATKIGGPDKGRFSRKLEGNGFVFAIKFRPGAFHPFFKQSLSKLTGKTVHPALIFGKSFHAVEKAVLEADSTEAMYRICEDFLRGILPPEDEQVRLINAVLDQIISDRRITRVEQLPTLSGKTVRSLQRLFSEYVGVSPKWVIARYRIHDALERVHENKTANWAGLALDLGYADQAHFIRDFKKLVGKTPLAYQQEKNKT